MKSVFSPISNTAFFKSHKKLYNAPMKDENTIDFERASKVDYFFLTTEEFEEAMTILSIFDEMEQDDEIH
jgi:hypothetical protein